MPRKSLVLLGGLLMAAPALAEIPRFDVETHCEQVAGFGGDFSNTMYNSCIDMEQGAYNGLKGRWATLPPTIQSHCEEVASFGGPGSYTMLQSCVDMEVSAGSNRSEFSFD
ncbi:MULTISPECIES: hypothetical protein [Halomonas]|uniref:hypothetical protein n=1 Tax=Halomonas TaxID=2745 RepID=UPI001C97492B|nr:MULTISPECIES: hypothetical protein [Halomonas]MBY6206904.1 hypothetical protein [Halomonas sp. DP3Y7-2]MBY6230378.1 hypothetical protein [Halomonas sp. DP3Y7-1]MCA0918538.1 hypothetical protein [Halomonas denitrificans]